MVERREAKAPRPDEVARLVERLHKAACGLRVDMYDYDAALMDEASDALTRLSLALAKAESELEGTGKAVPDVEAVAQWLHDEVEYPDPDFPNYSWPEHEDDTGQRDGGFLKIVPRDTREQFRDIARRLLRWIDAPAPQSSNAPSKR